MPNSGAGGRTDSTAAEGLGRYDPSTAQLFGCRKQSHDGNNEKTRSMRDGHPHAIRMPPKCRTSGCCIVNRVIVPRLDVATPHKGGCEHAEESSRVANHALRDLHRFSTSWRVDPMVF